MHVHQTDHQEQQSLHQHKQSEVVEGKSLAPPPFSLQSPLQRKGLFERNSNELQATERTPYSLSSVSQPLQQKSRGLSPAIQMKMKSSSGNVNSNAPIQMLIRTPYPWSGAVSGTPMLALRDAPQGNLLADLARNTLVTVNSNSSGWLGVSVDTSQSGVTLNQRGTAARSGNTLSGYSYHRYIDDAAAASMTSLLGRQSAWTPSGPGSSNTFDTWASAATEGAAPPVNSVTTINCWEMILLAAYRIGAVSWSWINNLYTNPRPSNNAELTAWYSSLPNRITRGTPVTYNQSTRSPAPQRGDLVFFDGASHVTLATGNGDEVLTFWPPPNISSYGRGTVDVVKTSSIHALSNWMATNMSSGRPTVTIGAPTW